MATIVGFIASSLDGYIADREGGLGWLKPFDDIDYGYGDFIAGIDTVVMGRTTYDDLPGLGIGWPYAEQRALIVTSRPLDVTHPGVAAWHDGVDALIAHLRAREGRVWVIGGGGLQSAFIAAGAFDRLDLFVIPVLLGDGAPLFPKNGTPQRGLTLADTRTYPKGMVRLTYTLG